MLALRGDMSRAFRSAEEKAGRQRCDSIAHN